MQDWIYIHLVSKVGQLSASEQLGAELAEGLY